MKRSLRACLIGFILSLLLALMPTALVRAQAAPGSVPQTNAPPLPPARGVPAHDYDLRHVKLDLRFDWAREQALGSATLIFTARVPALRRVEFDAANMTFAGVRLGTGAPLKYEADARTEKLRVSLDRAYAPGEEVTVVVSYHTTGASESWPAATTRAGWSSTNRRRTTL